MEQVLFWLFMPYDALIFLPHFWLKAIFGIATGLLIPRKIVGLLICAVGNAALYVYLSWKHGPNLPSDLIALAVWSIFAFVGVVWWVVGRILRWAIRRIARIPGGLQLVAAGVMLVIGLWLLGVTPHIALVWFIARIAGAGLVMVGVAFAIVGFHLLWEDGLALVLDDWRFRRSLR
jgi:hypothetical protein